MKTVFLWRAGMIGLLSGGGHSKAGNERHNKKRDFNFILNLSLAALILILYCLTATPLRAQWEQMKIGYSGSADQSGNYLAGSGANIFAVLGGSSVFVSHDDGTTWDSVNTFPSKSYIQSITVTNSDVFAVTNGGIFQSADEGNTWSGINGGVMDTTDPRALIQSGSNLVATTQNDGIFYTSDDGNNWMNAQGISGKVLALGATGSVLISSDTSRIYRSVDYGKNWSVVNDTLAHITTFASTGTELFAGRYMWPIPVTQSTIIDPQGGVFRSTDQGKSWEVFESNLPNPTYGPHVNTLAVHDTDMFAGLVEGFYTSKVAKDNWKEVGQELPNAVLSVYANDSYVFVGVDHGGVWRRPIFQITPVERDPVSPIPSAFRLEQNYPNPFNPTTIISYQLAKSSHVRLTVWNVLGRRVATLVNTDQQKGAHEVSFNASQLSSGIYFYRLQAGNKVFVKKMLLMK